MCKGLIGKKLGMTSLFTPEGQYVPVTVIELGPCVVTQVKSENTDGYNAIQLGFGTKKSSRINKPLEGHYKKSGGEYAVVREVAVDSAADYEVGQTVALDLFEVGERSMLSVRPKGVGLLVSPKGTASIWAAKRTGENAIEFLDRLATVHGRPKLSGAKKCRVITEIIARQPVILKLLTFGQIKISC